jgi:hypothetical protein
MTANPQENEETTEGIVAGVLEQNIILSCAHYKVKKNSKHS